MPTTAVAAAIRNSPPIDQGSQQEWNMLRPTTERRKAGIGEILPAPVHRARVFGVAHLIVNVVPRLGRDCLERLTPAEFEYRPVSPVQPAKEEW